jgi:hypothetical protein
MTVIRRAELVAFRRYPGTKKVSLNDGTLYMADPWMPPILLGQGAIVPALASESRSY